MAVTKPKAAPTSGLLKRNVHYINTDTGEVVRKGEKSGFDTIAECHVELNAKEVPELKLTVERTSTSLVYARESYVDNDFATKPRVVCFLHGFSQRPANYDTLLLSLAASGYVVIAPRVWLFDTVFASIPGSKRPGSFWPASQPAKLQTALLTDAIRSIAWARSKGMHSVSLVGHSMGGAMALVAARALTLEVQSVCTLGPAVGPTSITGVNEYLSLKEGDVDKFAIDYPNIPTLIATGNRDMIAPSRNVREVYHAFEKAKNPNLVGLVSIENGTHLGFQDNLNIDVPVLRLLDLLFSKILTLLVYGFGELFTDPGRQLQFSIDLLHKWLDTTFENVDINDLIDIVESSDKNFNICKFKWSKTKSQ